MILILRNITTQSSPIVRVPLIKNSFCPSLTQWPSGLKYANSSSEIPANDLAPDMPGVNHSQHIQHWNFEILEIEEEKTRQAKADICQAC